MLNRNRYPIAIFLTALVSYACAGPSSDTDEATSEDEALGINPNANAPLIDFCAVTSADATYTLSAMDDADVAYSGNGAYASKTNGCPRFVADFYVAPNASPASTGLYTNELMANGWIASEPTTEASCVSLRINVRIYRRAAGSSNFQVVSTAQFRGDWVDPAPEVFGGCFIEVYSGNLFPGGDYPNPNGTDRYRIAVSATINNLARPVKAEMTWTLEPPH